MSKTFIIIAIFFTFTIGLFFGILFTNEIKSNWKKKVITIIIALFVGCGLSGLLYTEQKHDIITWNDGYCECGGEWKFSNVEHLKNSRNLYFWYCDDCGKVIELHSNFKKGD